MIQQVNLYQDTGKSSASQGLNLYLLTLPLLCVILICFSLFTLWSVNQHEHQLQQLQQQLKKTEAHVQLLQLQHPTNQINSLLEQKLQRAKNDEHTLSEILKIFIHNSSDQTRGFSRYLSALAKQADGSTWLNRIYINAENNTMLFQGSSFTAERIPFFLQRLQNADVFKGRSFARLTLEESEQDPHQINFTVTSSLEEINEFNP